MEIKKIVIEFIVLTLAAFIGACSAFFLFKNISSMEASQKICQDHIE